MNDLISRQAVLDKAYEIDLSDTGNDIRIWVVDVAEVEKLPTAEPVKHGRWEYIEDKYIDVCKCSECGTVEYFNKGWKKFNFCPNCGARMEE